MEQREAPDLLTREYQCPALVAAWLRRSDAPELDPQWLKAAAEYQVYRYRHERPTLSQAMAAHEALQAAGEQAAADRWALDRIVGHLSRAGLYTTLLSDWLPPICRSEEPAVRAEALGQTGKQLVHIGDYDTALPYLKQALVIQQKIGDQAGFCVTLFNRGHLHWQNSEHEAALGAWVTVYRLARPIHLAQALDALESLADQLNLPGGLDGWEALARKMDPRDTNPEAG